MKQFTFSTNHLHIYYLIILIFAVSNLTAQKTPKQEMQQLSFMTGDWVGISRTFQNDSIIREVPAYEKINYSLDSNIITIDLTSEILQLHTVISYNEKDQTFYYNVFYMGGSGKYPAEFINGKLIVKPNETKRFIFNLTTEGAFQEYGEKFENGEWVKYFEDNFNKH